MDSETLVEARADASAGHLHVATRLKEVDAIATRATTLVLQLLVSGPSATCTGLANDVHSEPPKAKKHKSMDSDEDDEEPPNEPGTSSNTQLSALVLPLNSGDEDNEHSDRQCRDSEKTIVPSRSLRSDK